MVKWILSVPVTDERWVTQWQKDAGFLYFLLTNARIGYIIFFFLFLFSLAGNSMNQIQKYENKNTTIMLVLNVTAADSW